jgi:hypothetical protein
LGSSAAKVLMLVTTKMLVTFDMRIMIRSISIIAAKAGTFLLLRKSYSGSKINEIISAIKNGIRIILSSFKTTNEKTSIAIEANMPIDLLYRFSILVN